MVKYAAALLLCCSGVCAALSRPSLNVRLTTALTSYDSVKDSEFRCVVISPLIRNGRVLMPQGTIILGRVHRAKRVGLALVRERASIELDFREYELPDGRRFPFKATLRHIDNARESVNKHGHIKGILAANNPQSFLHGVWRRPQLSAFPRSFVGLTGVGGKIFSAHSMGPIGAAGLFAARLIMFRLPEPEIQLPEGTEMKLRIAELPRSAPSFEISQPATVPDGLAEWLADQPGEVTRPGGAPADDIINLAFAATREELVGVFRAAGWFEAELLNARTFARAYHSYTRQTGYPTAPVSKLLYQEAEPDLVFQKSLNSLSKRHHIRVWRTLQSGQEIWLASATHDVGIEFNTSLMNFSHKIDPRIDVERAKVMDDLSFTGCVQAASYVDRRGVSRSVWGASELVTDGRLAVMFLQPSCADLPAGAIPPEPAQPKSRLARIARRMMLEGRQYALRGNAYYWGYRLVTYRRSAKQQELAADN